MGISKELRSNGTVIRFDSDILESIESRLFDVDWLRAAGHYQGCTEGRDQAYFMSYANCEMVLRNFRRGGLMRRINRDRYLRTITDRSRPMREFALLGWMRAQSLPVPKPVAAMLTNAGPIYRAAIITERIPDAHTLEYTLRNGSLTPEGWDGVGNAIGRLHAHGVFHADLNCRNILIDADHQAWLIDFDKCHRKTPGGWEAKNLARLKRSLRKERDKLSKITWQEGDWASLLAGYAGTAGAVNVR